MRRVVQKKWRELSSLWQELYENNEYATEYQSYEFLTITKKGRPATNKPYEMIGVKEINYVLFNENRVIAIAPLLIKRTKNFIEAYIRGHYTHADHLDFIYRSDLSYDDFKFLMDTIRDSLGNVTFNFDRISDESLTCEYFKSYFPSGPTDVKPCVSITLNGSYDEWFKGLSKSVRTNIRNAKNRLEADNIKWYVDFYYGTRFDRSTNLKMMRLYSIRYFDKINFHFGIFDSLVKGLLYIRKLTDPITKLLIRSNKSFHAILYINGEIASFASGFICNDDRIRVARLAMDLRYSKYSPGGLIIDAAIKDITDKNQIGELSIHQFDLLRGADPYKYSYGGTTYYNYFFVG